MPSRRPSTHTTCWTRRCPGLTARSRGANSCSQTGHPAAGVGQHLPDLLSRQSVVDRERRRPQVERRRVHQVELGPVGHHQRDSVATADTEPGQPGRDPAHPRRVLSPGDGHRPAGGPQCHLLRATRRGGPKHLAHRDRRPPVSHGGLAHHVLLRVCCRSPGNQAAPVPARSRMSSLWFVYAIVTSSLRAAAYLGPGASRAVADPLKLAGPGSRRVRSDGPGRFRAH